ncbi:ATP-dependent endonuclease [Aeromicrobium sp. 50.2.37]|uniref:ATP-dependent nuclease n=1 Tax=Aeromicrobium sp. 50.2.37 TaxID=2969305 RepID=UPI002150245D|nr:ATP-binding protein [Aeromicrobium sp. 50.2.37]MCR4512957.1 AAA family ATPase [Aeromicrobium sp. 50.2.37]
MKITSVEISNFKAIKMANLDLHPTFNVLVGANGSGKSSVLQALHWMFQSGRNLRVEPRKGGLASTLSEKDAIYMPSPDYRSAGHDSEYGNTQGKPQLGLTVRGLTESGESVVADMWLKSARNEGISVHIPSGNPLVAALRDRSREFSAYIPGVAGIPLVEEKRSKLVVHRSAAAGDANTVLRNMLLLLKQRDVDGMNGLEVVENLVSEVMGPFSVRVEFDEDSHTRLLVTFKTGEMGGDRSYKPLELAGIGYLQVLQIFSYLVYFRPLILLVDEPDAHLYPIAQERLVEALSRAATRYHSQVLLTTHSPSIVRALPDASKVIWMKGGVVEADGDTKARQLMGWGLLDRRTVLVTEDSKIEMLRAIIAQWPDLERSVAIWPISGSGNLLSPDAVNGLQAILGDRVSIALHRDRDFMMPLEVDKISAPYQTRGYSFWVTKYSDVEAYWITPAVVGKHFNMTEDEAEDLIEHARLACNVDDAAIRKVRQKRQDALQKLNRDAGLPHYGDSDVLQEATIDGPQYGVMGKSMLSSIRSLAKDRNYEGASSFGKRVPPGLSTAMAEDLKLVLTRGR